MSQTPDPTPEEIEQMKAKIREENERKMRPPPDEPDAIED